MRVFLARKEKKLHSVLWVASQAECNEGLSFGRFSSSDGDGIKGLNEFLSAKDPYSLVSAIEQFGAPLSHKQLVLDSSFGKDREGFERVCSGEKFLTDYIDRYSNSSRRALANECWLLLPGHGYSEDKESAAKRVAQEYSIEDGDAIERAISQAGVGCLVVEEPLLDWIWAKNMLALMLSIKHALMSDAVETSAKPLESCGFSLNGHIKNLGFDNGHHASLVLPIMRSDYARFSGIGSAIRETVQDYFLPGGSGGTCRWAPYSYYGFRREAVKGGSCVALITANADRDRSCMSYVPESLALGDGGTFADYSNPKQKVLIEIQGDIEKQNELAKRLFNEFMRNRLSFGDYRCDFDNEGRLVSNTFETCLWLSLLGVPGLKLNRCENCGLPFFASENSLRRFCSGACQQSAYRETRKE